MFDAYGHVPSLPFFHAVRRNLVTGIEVLTPLELLAIVGSIGAAKRNFVIGSSCLWFQLSICWKLFMFRLPSTFWSLYASRVPALVLAMAFGSSGASLCPWTGSVLERCIFLFFSIVKW